MYTPQAMLHSVSVLYLEPDVLNLRPGPLPPLCKARKYSFSLARGSNKSAKSSNLKDQIFFLAPTSYLSGANKYVETISPFLNTSNVLSLCFYRPLFSPDIERDRFS